MSDTLLYLSRADVEALELPMAEVIEAVEAAFREKGSGRAETPPKPGIHTQPDAFIHAMRSAPMGPWKHVPGWIAEPLTPEDG